MPINDINTNYIKLSITLFIASTILLIIALPHYPSLVLTVIAQLLFGSLLTALFAGIQRHRKSILLFYFSGIIISNFTFFYPM